MKKSVCLLALTVSTILSIYGYTMYADNNSVRNEQDIINQVLNYPMQHIVARCQKDHKYLDEDMTILETELKKYLILAIVHKDSKLGNGMYSRDVDNLWHSFLLFTREYAAFCRDHAGFFIHHIPEIDEQRTPEKLLETQQDFVAFIESYEKTFNEEIHPIWLLDISAE